MNASSTGAKNEHVPQGDKLRSHRRDAALPGLPGRARDPAQHRQRRADLRRDQQRPAPGGAARLLPRRARGAPRGPRLLAPGRRARARELRGLRARASGAGAPPLLQRQRAAAATSTRRSRPATAWSSGASRWACPQALLDAASRARLGHSDDGRGAQPQPQQCRQHRALRRPATRRWPDADASSRATPTSSKPAIQPRFGAQISGAAEQSAHESAQLRTLRTTSYSLPRIFQNNVGICFSSRATTCQSRWVPRGYWEGSCSRTVVRPAPHRMCSTARCWSALPMSASLRVTANPL